jgi:hypothetical protein
MNATVSGSVAQEAKRREAGAVVPKWQEVGRIVFLRLRMHPDTAVDLSGQILHPAQDCL